MTTDSRLCQHLELAMRERVNELDTDSVAESCSDIVLAYVWLRTLT